VRAEDNITKIGNQ